MNAERLKKPLERLRRALAPPDGGGLTDGQLLARFVAGRDEAAFAALVRRHGPMVFGVCRRLLRHQQDTEDCFQAAFLVLAQKAGAIRRRESLASWLYGVAYRVALDARGAAARRRGRERQVGSMPQPEVMPAEPQDWRPLLDRELALLREDYRSAVVLCDLEGRSRREAARLLGVPEGTLSSRLARARVLLARRLAKCGVALSAAALAALAREASAAVPAPLTSATVRAALLIAAGQAAAVATPAALLMRGVMKAMFIEKLKVTATALVVVLALGTVVLACRVGSGPLAAQAAPQGGGRPLTELEALRKENELLKLNLQVVLEKVGAQGAELRALKGKAAQAVRKPAPQVEAGRQVETGEKVKLAAEVDMKIAEELLALTLAKAKVVAPDALKQAEAALKALREARDPAARRRAAETLEKAAKQLRDQPAKKAPSGDQPRRP
jgi:RNA polymerase sigma factor (sigma-70 family)